MNNIEFKVEGDILVIKVKLDRHSIENAPLSSTGKTRLVASTHGSTALGTINGRAVSMSLNVMAKV